MKTEVVPELKSVIDTAAISLLKSGEDSIRIDGADNKILVKLGTALAQQMLNGDRVLFPYSHDGKDYLVCIAEIRAE